MTVAHRTSESFSFIAKQDGHVIDIDDDLKILKVQYEPQVLSVAGAKKLPYTETALKQALAHDTPLVVLMTEDELKTYPADKVFSVSPTVNVKVLESITFANITSVPDKTALQHKTDTLTRGLRRTPEMAVVYVRLEPLTTHANPIIDLFQYGAHYTSVSGSYLKQDLVLNVGLKDNFKRGDVLAYNAGFFSPDPDSKQVNWNHGVTTTVALIEMGSTFEDSCMITKEFGEKLRMAPAHVRSIELTASTILHQIVNIGDHVETTDQLCVIEESDIEALSGVDDVATISFLSNLNRKVLRAKYHGQVAEINLYYSCNLDALHPSIVRLIKSLDRVQNKYAAASQNTLKENHYLIQRQVAVGTKYHGLIFENDTVLLLITISESITAGVGDKAVICNQAKSVIGEVMERPPSSESGVIIDMVFSASSVARRILNSPYIVGIGNRVLEKMETDLIDMWFK